MELPFFGVGALIIYMLDFLSLALPMINYHFLSNSFGT